MVNSCQHCWVGAVTPGGALLNMNDSTVNKFQAALQASAMHTIAAPPQNAPLPLRQLKQAWVWPPSWCPGHASYMQTPTPFCHFPLVKHPAYDGPGAVAISTGPATKKAACKVIALRRPQRSMHTPPMKVPKKAPSLAAPTIASLVVLLMWKASEMPSIAPPISPRSYLHRG